MDKPVRAADGPYIIKAEQGRTYYWCACGRSATQPFCNGSHKGTGITPVKHVAEVTKNVAFCGCKGTGTPPFCDGTHAKK